MAETHWIADRSGGIRRSEDEVGWDEHLDALDLTLDSIPSRLGDRAVFARRLSDDEIAALER